MHTAERRGNDEQAAFWNGAAGQAWVDLQSVLDQTLAPFTELLLQGAKAPAARVLDVGCGAGDVTLAFARALQAPGRCVGVDISEPLIASARNRAAREGLDATFICADAATHAFERGGFDLIVSRFGVMFFEAPVQAFAHLRSAASKDAELRFVAWRSPLENPFMTAAELAARPFLPTIPERQPDAPGQFAFADGRRTQSLLSQAGWSGVEVKAIDVECKFAETDLERYFTRLGPLGRVLAETDERTRLEIIKTVRAAFAPYVFGAEVRFTAACWSVRAQA